MAVQSVNGNVTQSVSFQETALLAFNTLAPYSANLASGNLTYAAGTAGAGNVDTIYANQYTLASTTVAIDLFAGTLLSPSGKACVFARVREFIVQVVDVTAGHLVKVYGAASNAPLWLPPVANFLWATPNGGILRLSSPNDITTQGYLVDTSHKAVTFDSASNTVVFNVLIVGNSSAS